MEYLPIANIKIDGGTQSRIFINDFVVDEYAEAMQSGDNFPPVTVFHDGECYWLADGFHRVKACQKVGIDVIECDIRQGGRLDAIRYSLSANSKNGVRPTRYDTRKAVSMAWHELGLSDCEAIAEACGCSIRSAREYTQQEREKVKTERNAAIHADHEAGLKTKEIAKKYNITQKTVQRELATKRQAAEMSPDEIAKQGGFSIASIQDMENMEFHPIADLFPMVDDEKIALIAESIKEHGLISPGWMYEGKLLDGRIRFKACVIADVPFTYKVYTGDDPMALSLSLNLRREHYTEGQRACVAVRLMNYRVDNPTINAL